MQKSRGLIQLLHKLLNMGRARAAEAVLGEVCELFRSSLILPINNSQKSGMHDGVDRDMRSLLEKIPEQAMREFQCIRDYHMPLELTEAYYTRSGVRLQIFLEENDPGNREDEDSLLVDMAIPLECLQAGKGGYARIKKEYGSFAEFVYSHAQSSLKTYTSLDLNSLWVDLDISFYMGMKLNPVGVPLLMAREELATLLQWQTLPLDGYDERLTSHDQQQVANVPEACSKLLFTLEEVMSAIDYEVPTTVQRLYSSRFAATLEDARKELEELRLRFSGADFISQDCKFPKPASVGVRRANFAEERQNVQKLDRAFRILEPAAKKLLNEAEKISTLKSACDPAFLPDANPPELNNLTLWTRDNGDLSRHFMALPLMDVKYACANLICTGNGWSEVPELAENMEYLTHIIVYDSDFPLGHMGKTDYITLRIDFSRQFYRNFK